MEKNKDLLPSHILQLALFIPARTLNNEWAYSTRFNARTCLLYVSKHISMINENYFSNSKRHTHLTNVNLFSTKVPSILNSSEWLHRKHNSSLMSKWIFRSKTVLFAIEIFNFNEVYSMFQKLIALLFAQSSEGLIKHIIHTKALFNNCITTPTYCFQCEYNEKTI